MPEHEGNSTDWEYGTPTFPLNQPFGKQLEWHLRAWGTRPDGCTTEPGEKWLIKEFVIRSHLPSNFFDKFCSIRGNRVIYKKSISSDDIDRIESAVSLNREWRSGAAPSGKNDGIVDNIYQLLFGTNREFDKWKKELERALQQVRQEADARQRRAQDKITRPPTIPRLTLHFLGRDGQVKELADTIISNEKSAILVYGGPGIGKTELTKAVAHHPDIASRFGDGRWFVPLEASTDIQGVLNAFCAALGTDISLGVKGIISRLSSAPNLLILDNIETPWEIVETQCELEGFLADLANLPGVVILASQRGSNFVRGPIWTGTHAVEELNRSDAAKLFMQVGHFENPTDRHFAKFLKVLGGVPLALTLVALRAQGHTTLGKLWAEWERIGTKLARKQGFEMTRLTSLAVSIELSLGSPLLDNRAKRLFKILGRLPDGLSEHERNVVAGEDSFDLEEALRRVGLAIERNDRLGLLPPIREYARRLPLASDDELRWIRCVLTPVRELQDDHLGAREQNYVNFQEIREGLGNVETSVCHLMDIGDDNGLESYLEGLIAVSRRYGLSVNTACRLRDHYSGKKDMQSAHGKASLIMAHIADRTSHLELADVSFKLAIMSFKNEGDNRALMSAHLQFGEYQNRRERHRGRENFLRARDISRRLQDDSGEVGANVGLALASLMDSSYNLARKTLEKSIEYYREKESWIGEAECSEALARVYEVQSIHGAALGLYLFAESVWRAHGFRLNLAECLVGKAGLHFKMGELDAAQVSSDEALSIFSDLGDEKGVADCLYRRATLRYYQDDDGDALTVDLERAEDIYSRINDNNGLGHCTYFRSQATDQGESSDIYKEFLISARDYFRAAGNVCERSQCSYDLASLAYSQDKFDEMLEHLVEAGKEFAQRDDVIGVMNCQLLYADFYITAGDFKEAEEYLTATLEISRAIGSQLHEAQALQKLAHIFSKHQRHNEARAAYKQAAELYKHLAMPDEESICLGQIAN